MMSHKEFGRLRGFIDLEDGRISVLDAATPPRRHAGGLRPPAGLPGAGEPSTHGPDALVSKRRGRPSNRAHGAAPSFARPS